jgi:hypothetical protein
MPAQKREARLRAGVAGIHVFLVAASNKTWMAGTSPAMTNSGFFQ